jgi:hypothetical protein
MFVTELDPQGNSVGSRRPVDFRDVASKIKQMDDEETAKAAELYGPGRSVPLPSGASVSYNGKNSAGVDAEWMLQFRDKLVQHEGVIEQEKDDITGRKDQFGRTIRTVGIGMASTNTFYPKPGPDGKISPEQLQQSFMQATNHAAKVGRSMAQRSGLNNQAGFLLMSEIAYHAGEGAFVRNDKVGAINRDFRKALESGNVTAAQEAFKRTPMWRWSGDKNGRRQNYLSLIEQAMKGQ